MGLPYAISHFGRLLKSEWHGVFQLTNVVKPPVVTCIAYPFCSVHVKALYKIHGRYVTALTSRTLYEAGTSVECLHAYLIASVHVAKKVMECNRQCVPIVGKITTHWWYTGCFLTTGLVCVNLSLADILNPGRGPRRMANTAGRNPLLINATGTFYGRWPS